jgi:hypothetical protein
MDVVYYGARATSWALHLASCIVLPYVLGAVAKVDLESKVCNVWALLPNSDM